MKELLEQIAATKIELGELYRSEKKMMTEQVNTAVQDFIKYGVPGNRDSQPIGYDHAEMLQTVILNAILLAQINIQDEREIPGPDRD